APGTDAKPQGDGAQGEGGGGGDTGAGADAPGEVGSEAGPADAPPPPDTGGTKDAPPDVPAETGGVTYAQQVLLDSPAAYWRLGEASGNTAKDASGNGVNGVYQGSIGLGAKGAIANDPDTAATFDGATSFVDAGQVFQFASNAAFSL